MDSLGSAVFNHSLELFHQAFGQAGRQSGLQAKRDASCKLESLLWRRGAVLKWGLHSPILSRGLTAGSCGEAWLGHRAQRSTLSLPESGKETDQGKKDLPPLQHLPSHSSSPLQQLP